VALKLPWQTILIEIFTIVLGVMLALALNQWRENRNNDALVNIALENVLRELESNQEVLALIHENNTRVLDASAADSAEDSFIPGLQLQETAWETLQFTGVSVYVDYNTILVTSNAYSTQKLYKQIGTIMTGAAMNAAALSGTQAGNAGANNSNSAFRGYQQLLVDIEALLLSNYGEALAHLKTRPR